MKINGKTMKHIHAEFNISWRMERNISNGREIKLQFSNFTP